MVYLGKQDGCQGAEGSTGHSSNKDARTSCASQQHEMSEYWNMDVHHGSAGHGSAPVSAKVRHHRGSSEEMEQEGHEQKVTTLDLFSDLVMVVAIHIVAHPLEDKYWNYNGWDTEVWYVVHAFQLWLCWHTNMIGSQVSHLLNDHGDYSVANYVIAWAYMVSVLLLARHQAAYNHNVALAVFMGVRLLLVATLYYRAYRPPPSDFDPDHLATIRSIPKSLLKIVLIGEIMPLTLAILATPMDDEPYAPLAFLSIAFNVAHRTYFAIRADKVAKVHRWAGMDESSEAAAPSVQLFNDDLLKERYELINLIFLGEIAFACTAGPTDRWFTVLTFSCAMIGAFGCFLLSFAARPAHSISLWRRSNLNVSTGHHLYACLFLLTPAIAAGFYLIGDTLMEYTEAGEEGGHRYRWLYEYDDDWVDDMMCTPGSAWLLSLATALYLLFVGLIHFMTWESSHIEYNLSKAPRLFFRILFAMAAIAVMHLPERLSCMWQVPVATLLCPLILVFASFVEIWGVQDKNGRKLELGHS